MCYALFAIMCVWECCIVAKWIHIAFTFPTNRVPVFPRFYISLCLPPPAKLFIQLWIIYTMPSRTKSHRCKFSEVNILQKCRYFSWIFGYDLFYLWILLALCNLLIRKDFSRNKMRNRPSTWFWKKCQSSKINTMEREREGGGEDFTNHEQR